MASISAEAIIAIVAAFIALISPVWAVCRWACHRRQRSLRAEFTGMSPIPFWSFVASWRKVANSCSLPPGTRPFGEASGRNYRYTSAPSTLNNLQSHPLSSYEPMQPQFMLNPISVSGTISIRQHSEYRFSSTTPPQESFRWMAHAWICMHIRSSYCNFYVFGKVSES